MFFFVQQRSGNEHFKGCNYFKWCNEDILDERDATIGRQSKKINDLEEALIHFEKWVKFLIGTILFLGLINIIIVYVLFKIR